MSEKGPNTGLRERLARPSAAVMLAGAAATVLGVFTLAWRTPASTAPVVSMSYAVGYDNRVAWAAVLAGCALAAVSGVLARREDAAAREASAGDAAPDGSAAAGEAPSGDAGSPDHGAPGIPRGDVIALTLLTALAASLFCWATWGVPVFDNGYFFHRIAQTLGGAVPWRDFEFPYGPLMIYVPTGLAWLAARLGADAVLGYYVALLVSHVAGVPLLAWIAGRVPIARGLRRALFWVIGLYALMTVMGGLNYTLLRFASPLAGLVVLWDLVRRERPVPPAAIGAVTLALTLACAALSPELGVAFAVAATGLLAFAPELEPVARRVSIVVPAVGLAAVALAFGRTVLDIVGLRAGGALTMPVLPSPYVLFYLASALMAARALGSGALTRVGGFPAAPVALLGLVLVPAALGRADHGHVFWNALPLLLAGAVMVSRGTARRSWAWLGVAALVLTAWTAVYDTMAVPTAFDAAVRAAVAPKGALVAAGKVLAPAVEDVGERYDTGLAQRPRGETLERLLALDDVAMPFGCADAAGFELALAGRLVPTASDDNGPLDEAQYALVARDLESAEWVVIPTSVAIQVGRLMESADAPASMMPPYAGRPYTLLLQFPVELPVVRREYGGAAALGALIAERFEPVETVGWYSVLRRRD